jgi:TRAP-type uncharacterized transport system substrate-binding protein
MSRFYRNVHAILFVILFLSVFFGVSVRAQTLSIATGAEKGSTYTQMFNELKTACTTVPMQAVYTNGSITNIEMLIGNKVNAAFAQSDLLFSFKEADAAKVANIKTIVGLHPEELHFIARADVKQEGGYGFGKYKFGGEKISFNTLSDLTGRPVGAVGGSAFSGRVVSQYGALKLQIVEFPNNDALKTALLDGTVDAILVVGGAPHALVASLDQRYRILPVSPDTQRMLKDVYTPVKVSYSNLNAVGIPTVATQALLVSRVYNGQAMIDRLSALRKCFNAQLGDIKDTTGTHPKWQDVRLSETGKWPLYELK